MVKLSPLDFYKKGFLYFFSILVSFFLAICITPVTASAITVLSGDVEAELAVQKSLAMEGYVNLLEKTNEQLSLGWTPYNTAIAVFGFATTFIAILFAVFTFTQSRDYQRQLNKRDEDYKKNLETERESFVANLNKRSDEHFKVLNKRLDLARERKENLDKIILKYEKELGKIPKGQKGRVANIEKSIKKLEEERSSLQFQINDIPVTPESSIVSSHVSASPLGYVFSADQ